MGTLVTGVSSLSGISPSILNWFSREEFNILFAQVLQEPPKSLPHLQICDPHLPATKQERLRQDVALYRYCESYQ
jgi:hypothetical protein